MDWKIIKKLSISLFVWYLLGGLFIYLLSFASRINPFFSTAITLSIGIIGFLLVIAVGPFLIGYKGPFIFGSKEKSSLQEKLVSVMFAVVANVLTSFIITKFLLNAFNSFNAFIPFLLSVFDTYHTSFFMTTFCREQIYRATLGSDLGFCFFTTLDGIPTIIIVIAITFGFMKLGNYVREKRSQK